MDVHNINASIWEKLGLVSVSKLNEYARVGKFSLFICYLQCLGILIKSASLALPGETIDVPRFIARYTIVSDAMDFSGDSSLSFVVLIILIIHCKSLVFDTSCILFSLKYKRPIHKMMIAYWSFECYIHPMILMFPIHNICLRAIYSFHKGQFKIVAGEGGQIALIVILYCCLFINLIFGYCFTSLFRPVIKTKDPYCSKNLYHAFFDFGRKTFIPVLWILGNMSDVFNTLAIIVNLFDLLSMSYILFKYLPFYRTNMLFFSGNFLSTLTAFSFSTLISFLLKDTRYQTGYRFAVWSGLVLWPVFIKIYKDKIISLLENISFSESDNHFYTIHKHYIWKYFISQREKPHEKTRKINFEYFYNIGRLSFLSQKYLKMDLSNFTEDDIKKFSDVSVYVVLKKAREQHPKSFTLKIILADHLIKHYHAYLQAFQLLEEVLKQSISFPIKLSALMVREKLRNLLVRKYKHEDSGLDLLQCEKVFRHTEELRVKIQKQIGYQISFWQNFLQQTPDLQKMINLAEKTLIQREEVEAFWRLNKRTLQMKSKRPVIIYMTYLSLVNNKFNEAKNLHEFMNRIIHRDKPNILNDELSKSTIFANDSCQLYVHGCREKLGIIAKVSKSFDKFYGSPGRNSEGKTINILLPNFYRAYHDKILHSYYETGKITKIGKTVLVPTIAANGYILPCWLHIRLCPEISEGIKFFAVLRQKRTDERMVLVNESGWIEGMSEDFAEDMQPSSQISIFDVCPDFKAVNSAFNKLAHKLIQESSNESYEFINIHPPKDDPHTEYSSTGTKLMREESWLTDRNLIEQTKLLENQLTTRSNSITSSDRKECVLTSEEADLIEKFKEGEKIIFYPARNITLQVQRDIMLKRATNQIEYNITVRLEILEKSFIKVIMLKKTQDSEKFNKPSESSGQNPNSIVLINPSSMILPNNNLKTPDQYGKATSDESQKTAQFQNQNSNKDNFSLLSGDFLYDGEILDNHELMYKIQNHVFLPEDEDEKPPTFKSLADEMMIIPGAKTDIKPTMIFPSETSFSSHYSDNSERNKKYIQHEVNIFDKLDELGYKRHLIPREVGLIEKLGFNMKKKVKTFFTTNYAGNAKTLRALHSSKIPELIEESLSKNKMTKVKKLFHLTFAFLMCFFVISLVILNTNLLDAVDNTNQMRTIIHDIYFTSTYLVVSDTFIKLNMLVKQGFISASPQTGNFGSAISSLDIFKYYFAQFIDERNSLLEKVSQLNPACQEIFFEKNIRIKAPNETTSSTSPVVGIQGGQGSSGGGGIGDSSFHYIGIDDYLHATQKLIDYGLSIEINDIKGFQAQMSYTKKFILNTLDDFVITTLNIADYYQGQSVRFANNRKEANWFIFMSNMFVVTIFMVVSMRTMQVYAQESQKFANVLLKIPYEQAQAIEHTLSKVKEINTNFHDFRYLKELFLLKQSQVEILKKKGHHQIRKADLGDHYKNIQRLFLRLLPFLVTLTAVEVTFFVESLSQLKQARSSATKAFESTLVLFQENLFNSIMTTYFLTSAKGTVQNQDVEVVFKESVQALSRVNDFINSFRDDDGNLKSMEYDIFFKFECSRFKDYEYVINVYNFETTYNACIAVSTANNTVSLINIFQTMSNEASNYFTQYNSATSTDLQNIFTQASSLFSNLMETSRSLFFILIDSITKDFLENSAFVKAIGYMFIGLAVVCDVLIGVVTMSTVINKIMSKNMERKKILRLVPTDILVSNTFLRTYLVTNSPIDLNLNHVA